MKPSTFRIALGSSLSVNAAVTPDEKLVASVTGGTPAGAASAEVRKPVIPDYELIRLIGRGSYGDVWLARGLTGVFRAIKVVWRDRYASDEPFNREFAGLKQFTTMAPPGSEQLALLHIGRSERDGLFYYVMELADDAADGRRVDPERYVPLTLKELRTRKGRIAPPECVTIGLELARALAGLHALGLVHRDIKPSNVIFVGGLPKLADIGMVAATDDHRSSLGTEGFVPPEGTGRPPADVYALGKVLYEISTGFDRQDFPRLPADLRQLPDWMAFLELNEVILRACEPGEGRRYPDGATLLEDLLELQGGHSIRARRSRSRTRWLAASVALAAGAAAAYWWSRRPPTTLAAPPSEERQLIARAWEQTDKSEFGAEELKVAEGLCKRASELDPADPDLWAASSQVDSWMVARRVDNSPGRRESARSKAERALKLAPNSYEARLAQACYLVRAAPLPSADDSTSPYAAEGERLLLQLLKEKPNEPRALRAYAFTELSLGNIQRARIALVPITRNPRQAAWAWLTLASTDFAAPETVARGDVELDHALAIEPLAAAYIHKINIALHWYGDLAKAKDTLERVPPSLAQTDVMVWTVSLVYTWRREPDLLLRYLQGIPRDWIHGLEFNGPTSLLIGNAQWMAGRKKAAQLEWRAALKLVDQRLADQSTDALQSDWRGVLLGRLGEFAEAEKAMRLAGDLLGRDGFDWGDLFELKMEEGQLDAAMDIYDKQWPMMAASYMRVCPFFDPLRDNPRFKAALARAEADPKRSPYAKGRAAPP